MPELVPVRPPEAPPSPHAVERAPIPVLAEGTAPVAIAYRPARRRTWPSVVAGVAIAATATVAYAVYGTREARREREAQYPIAATTDEKAQLAAGAERWSRGRAQLLATLAAFDAPALDTLKGVGACTLHTSRSADEMARASLVSDGEAPAWDDRDLDVSLRHVILPDETVGDLAALARPEVDHLIAAAQRGRFRTPAGRDHIVRSLGGALVVVRVSELHPPELDREHDAFAPGVMAGTAYAFDPATGALRCAGAFRATSSDTLGALSSYTGLDRAHEAAIRDLDTQVEAALGFSLRSVD